jgi:hypothetical protein
MNWNGGRCNWRCRSIQNSVLSDSSQVSQGIDKLSMGPEKKVVGLERGPLSLVSTTEELLDRKVAAPV